MDYEEEDVALGSVPEFGAIFMSNDATKRECFRRKLLGLPSAQGNFVKQVKAGMVLFLFEFERRELYGVYRACCDGAMDIVPHAYSSSGKQFPAQVRFTVIWYCNPLSEHEFRHAIKENYFSKKKFKFGLSEDQVRRLLWLFSSRKLENRVPQRQLNGQASNLIGKEKGVSGNGRFNRSIRGEELVEEDSPAPSVTVKYNRNSLSNNRRLDDNRSLESYEHKFNNSPGYDILTDHDGASSSKRRRIDDGSMLLMEDKIALDSDVAHGFGQAIRTDNLGDPLNEQGRVSGENRFLLCDTDESEHMVPVIIPENSGDSLAKAAKLRRAINYDRFQKRDIIGDQRSQTGSFQLVKPNPEIHLRRAIDDKRLFMGHRVHYEHNLGGGPKTNISANQVLNSGAIARRTSDDGQLYMNDMIEIGRSVNNSFRPNVSAEYLDNRLDNIQRVTDNEKFLVHERREVPIELQRVTDDEKLLVHERREIPTEHFLSLRDFAGRANYHDKVSTGNIMECQNNVDDSLGPVTSAVPSGHPLEKRKQLADNYMLLEGDRVDNACHIGNSVGPLLSTRYADLYQPRQEPSFSSRTMLGTHCSLGQGQHKPPSLFSGSTEQNIYGTSYPGSCSMEQNMSEVSYLTSRDSIVTRAVPNDLDDVPDIHHIRSSSLGVNCTSHSVQDFLPHHNRVGNNFAASFYQSSPYIEAKVSQQSDVASRCVSGGILSADQNLYNLSRCRIGKSLLSGGYCWKKEEPLTSHEISEDLLPSLRGPIYERPNASPSVEFYEHAGASQDRFSQKVPENETYLAFGDHEDPIANNNTGCLHSGFNNYDISSYRDRNGSSTDSKNERISVFSRLTLASKEQGQESGCYMEHNELDALVDEVMDTPHKSLNHKTTNAKKLPSVGLHETRQVTEGNDNEIAKETRVVDFKSRSGSKRSWDGTKANGYGDSTLDQETKGSVQKPEGEDGEGEGFKNERISVLSRLTLAPKEQGQESGSYVEHNEWDALVDDVMDTFYKSLNHKITNAKKLPSVELHDTEEAIGSKRQDKGFNQIECDTLTMTIKNETRPVTEENDNEIAKETRVVDFKRRSESKRSRDGTKARSYDDSNLDEGRKGCVQKPEGEEEGEGKKFKCRKLVRPVFGKKEALNDGVLGLQLLSHGSSGDNKSVSCEKSGNSQETGTCSSHEAQFGNPELANKV